MFYLNASNFISMEYRRIFIDNDTDCQSLFYLYILLCTLLLITHCYLFFILSSLEIFEEIYILLQYLISVIKYKYCCLSCKRVLYDISFYLTIIFAFTMRREILSQKFKKKRISRSFMIFKFQ